MFDRSVSLEEYDDQKIFKYPSYDHESEGGIAAHAIDLLARAAFAVSGIFLMAASAWTAFHFSTGSALFIGGLTLPGGLAILGGAVGLFAISYFFHSICDRRNTA